MRYSAFVFLSALSQRLRSVKCWLVMLLLPFLIFGVSYRTETDESNLVTVGVVLPESGAEELWALLSEYNEDILSFVVADTLTVDRNVAAGKWDCGLIFGSDFRERLEEGNLDQSIEVRIGPGSTVYPLVQETVSACVARQVSPVIAREYLLDSGIANPEHDLEQRLELILSETKRVDITMTALDGTELFVPELNQQGKVQVLCWLISAVILVRILFGSADLSKWIASSAVKRLLPIRSEFSMLAARAAADWVIMAASGCLAMAFLGKGIWGCLAVLEYTLFWSALSVLAARFPGTHGILPVCLPFALVISFLLSSALVDISIVLPAISGISEWIPSALFLRICKGDPAAASVLFMFSLLCCLFSCLIWKTTGTKSKNIV